MYLSLLLLFGKESQYFPIKFYLSISLRNKVLEALGTSSFFTPLMSLNNIMIWPVFFFLMDFLSLLSSNDSVTHTHLSSVRFFFFFFFKHYLFKITHQFIHQLFLKHKKSCTNFSNEVSSNEPGLYVNTQTKKSYS